MRKRVRARGIGSERGGETVRQREKEIVLGRVRERKIKRES